MRNHPRKHRLHHRYCQSGGDADPRASFTPCVPRGQCESPETSPSAQPARVPDSVTSYVGCRVFREAESLLKASDDEPSHSKVSTRWSVTTTMGCGCCLLSDPDLFATLPLWESHS